MRTAILPFLAVAGLGATPALAQTAEHLRTLVAQFQNDAPAQSAGTASLLAQRRRADDWGGGEARRSSVRTRSA